MQRYFILYFLALLTAGCSATHNYIQARENFYQTSHEQAPLKVPPGFSAKSVGQDYTIPVLPRAENQSASMPNLIPPGETLNNSVKKQATATKPSAASLPEETTNNSVSSSIMGSSLTINQPIKHAWVTIGTALTQSGYKVLLENEHTQTYYLLDNVNHPGPISRSTPIYQLHLHKTGLGTQVSLTDNTGKIVSPSVAQPILTRLNNAISGNNAKASAVGSTSNLGDLLRRVFH